METKDRPRDEAWLAEVARHFHLYMLDGHTPVPAPDLIAWAQWYEVTERHVAETVLEDGTRVSTVFLGVDAARGSPPPPPPQLFETMRFTPDGQGDCAWRCATWEEAEAQHWATVRRLTGA